MTTENAPSAAPLKVEELWKSQSEALKLTVLAGQGGYDRLVRVADINRPGLTLAGFFDFYRGERIQVFGQGESAFISTLSSAQRMDVFERILSSSDLPCLIITHGKDVVPEIQEECDRLNVPLFRSEFETARLIGELTAYLEERLAPSTSVLIAARLLQGVGGAVMMPSTLSILTNTFPDARERARAIGLWAGISGLAMAIGPLVGGTMVDRLGWQSIFWINLPIGIIALVLAARFVPESSDRAGRTLDIPGQITAIVGLATLTYAFIEANTYGWTSARILSCFIVAALSLSLFLFIEVRGTSPMLQLKFFRNWTFSGANLVGVIVSFAFFGVIFFLSLFLQNVQGYSPAKSGVLE